MKNILDIKNVDVFAGDTKIINNLSLQFKPGEIHAIMGPNGNGKSTLLQTIMGNPNYEVKKGEIIMEDKNINDLAPDVRSKMGIFLAMQQPQEITGVSTIEFLRSAMNAHSEKKPSFFEFYSEINEISDSLKLDKSLLKRHLNEKFSGGEKKRNEILQMLLLKPKVILIDEIDSGLDVDGLTVISNVLKQKIKEDKNVCFIIVSHYERIFKLIKPDHVHLMIRGEIIKSGGEDLIKKIDKEGYDWIKKELGFSIEEDYKPTSISSCGVRKSIGK